jgi:hypothetical protein
MALFYSVRGEMELKVMAKPMTQSQREHWAKVRVQGRGRFILMEGILRFGLSFTLLMLILQYFGLAGRWHGWTFHLLEDASVALLAGISFALIKWRNEERRFEERD